MACNCKFFAISKQHKDDKIATRILSNHCHECFLYDALDGWWHQNENVMKHASAPTNEIDEIVNSLQFQINFKSDFMDHGNKEPLNKPFTLEEVFSLNKKKKTMFMNTFQPSMKIVQQYYNNLQKPMFYSNI